MDRFLSKEIIRVVSLLLTLLGMVALYQWMANEVNLVLDGREQVKHTHARSVANFIVDINLEIEPEDHLNVPIDEPISDGMRIELERARNIQINHAGVQKVVRSAANSPVNILNDGGIRIFPGDTVWVNGVKPIDPASSIESSPETIKLTDGLSFDVLVDGSSFSLRSSAPTVGAALLKAGIVLLEGDRVEPGLDTLLEPGTQVIVERSQAVMISMGDQTLSVNSAAGEVGELLIDAGISISGLDYTIPDLEDPVPEDGVVRVVQVEEDVKVELEPLAFETVYQPLEQLELDQLQVQNQGTFGVLAERVRIRYEDGEEVSRSVEEAVTVVEPEPRVIGYGTKIVVRSINTEYGTIEYWRAVPVYATSYSPCRLGVDRCGFVTAAGTGVDRGTIGVIRSWFNLMRGWSVFVPGYGPGSIQDIGAGFSDRDWIDLGFTDEEYEAWYNWTTLYFLTPVPPLDQIPWILP